jgi:hypothetical protein
VTDERPGLSPGLLRALAWIAALAVAVALIVAWLRA